MADFWECNPSVIHTNYDQSNIRTVQLVELTDECIDKIVRKIAETKPVVKGEWIQDRLCSTSGGTYGVRRCSVCEHYFQDLVNEYNYCPNCGAEMGGDSK